MTPAEAAEILRVRDPTNPCELRRRWRAAARQHHPDVGGDALLFAQVQLAYETLSADTATSPWPSTEDLPIGATWVEVVGSAGLAWVALAGSVCSVGEVALFTRLDRGRLETVVVEPGPLTGDAGSWSVAPRGTGFDDAARRWCSSVRSPDLWVATLPTAQTPVDLWAMRELDAMCESASLRPDVATMQAAAERLQRRWSNPGTLQADDFRSALAFALAVAQALARNEL